MKSFLLFIFCSHIIKARYAGGIITLSSESETAPAKQGKLLYRLFKWVLSATFIMTLILILAVYLQIRPVMEQREAQLQHEAALRSARLLKDYIVHRTSELRTIASALGMSLMEYERQKSLAESLLKLEPSFVEVSVVDSKGREFIRTGRAGDMSGQSGADFSNRPLFIEASKGITYAGVVKFSPGSEPLQELAVPIQRDGEFVGMLVGTIRFSPVSQELASFRTGNTGISYIVDSDGRLLAHNNLELLPLGSMVTSRSAVKRTTEGKEIASFEEDSLYTNEKGKKVAASSILVNDLGPGVELGGGGYGVIVEREASEALEPLWLLLRLIALISAGTMLLMAAAIMMGSRWILTPLQQLHEGAMALGAGMLTYRVDIKSGDELEALGRSFNNMAERLQDAMSSVSDSESQFRAIVENMAEGLILRDKDRKLLYVNPALCRMLGYTREEITAMPDLATTIDAGLREKATGKNFELRDKVIYNNFVLQRTFLTKSGEKIPAMISGNPVLDSEGNFKGAVVIFTDLRELKRLQDEREKILRLAAIGEIAAVVSHEFRNSLGAINNSIYVLRSRLKDPDDKVERNLVIMSQAIVSSTRIISNLLDFARPKEPSFQSVSLNQIVNDAISAVAFPDVIKLSLHLDASLPAVKGDAEMLRRVVMNLLLNAVDAMPGGGNLRVTTTVPNEYVEARVNDMGDGIHPEVLAKIFDPFFTTKAKGTGLGLYVSKQIMERHGGSIEVESQAGKGSTFIVRLPVGGGNC